MSDSDQKLSIIVPCYNAAGTLDQAVNSVFITPPHIPFEVILVDDGSTDDTKKVMHKLADAHQEIKLIFHDKNKGGGAARNTGLAAAAGTLVYCLDADNFFAAGTLPKLTTFMQESDADGVLFEDQRFFFGTDPGHYSSQSNKAFIGQSIGLKTQFAHPELVIDNFLHRKSAFLAAGGYPEHHGFDTQSYQVRFLAAGRKLAVCPGTIFYHRMAQKGSTYFERVYNEGNMSLNYYLIIEDIFDRLSDEAKKMVLDFDVFARSTMDDNLLQAISVLGKNDRLLRDGISSRFVLFDEYLADFRAGRYEEALGKLGRFAKDYGPTKILAYNSLRCLVGLAGTSAREIEKTALELGDSLRRQPHRLFRSYHRFYWVNKLAATIASLKKLFNRK